MGALQVDKNMKEVKMRNIHREPSTSKKKEKEKEKEKKKRRRDLKRQCYVVILCVLFGGV